MNNQNKKRNLNQIKLQFAVAIGYFHHANLFLNILSTIIINLLAGVILVGFSASLLPLISGNYVHFIYFFLIFTIGELIIRYALYSFAFNAIVKTRGILLFPYYLILFYLAESFVNVEFVSFIAIFLFTFLYALTRGGIRYLYSYLKSLFAKKGETPWKRP